jgi:rare lipoprotein A
MLGRIVLALVLCVCVATGAEAKKKRSPISNASYYSCCAKTANGERFNAGGMTVAHKTLPFGTRVLLTNPGTGRSVCVRVNDRGPFVRGRTWDVTRGVAVRLGFVRQGVANLRARIGGC